jgi:Family of unknown function (DUF6256)
MAAGTLRNDVVPMLAAAPVIGVALGLYWRERRRTAPEPRSPTPRPSHALGRFLVRTAVPGYLLFIVIVVAFSSTVSRPLTFITQALWGGAFLAFAAGVPSFLLMSWLADMLARRGRRPSRG